MLAIRYLRASMLIAETENGIGGGGGGGGGGGVINSGATRIERRRRSRL